MGRFYHREVLLSWGDFIIGRFCYHGKVSSKNTRFTEVDTVQQCYYFLYTYCGLESRGSSKLNFFLCDRTAVLVLTHYHFHSACTVHSLRIVNFRGIIGFVLVQL